MSAIFDMIYYINMDKDVDRNENMIKLFKDLKLDTYTRIKGEEVDYRDYDESTYRNFNKRNEKYLNGQLGCREGHLNAVRHARDNNYNRVLIFEDDVWCDPKTDISQLLTLNYFSIITGDMNFFGGMIEPHMRSQIVCAHTYSLNKFIFDDIINMATSSGMEIDNFYAKIIQHMSCNHRPTGKYRINTIEPFNAFKQNRKFNSNIATEEIKNPNYTILPEEETEKEL